MGNRIVCPACDQGLSWDGHTEHVLDCPEHQLWAELFEWRPTLADLLQDMLACFQQGDRMLQMTGDPNDVVALELCRRFHRTADLVQRITGVDPRPALEEYLNG